jgi:hypothetical protein
MSTVEASITLAKDGMVIEFEQNGQPIRFSEPQQERRMTIRALRAALAEARRYAASIGEIDLAAHYGEQAERIEKELDLIGAK